MIAHREGAVVAELGTVGTDVVGHRPERPAPLSFVDADTGRALKVRVTIGGGAPGKRSTDIRVQALMTVIG